MGLLPLLALLKGLYASHPAFPCPIQPCCFWPAPPALLLLPCSSRPPTLPVQLRLCAGLEGLKLVCQSIRLCCLPHRAPSPGAVQPGSGRPVHIAMGAPLSPGAPRVRARHLARPQLKL